MGEEKYKPMRADIPENMAPEDARRLETALNLFDYSVRVNLIRQEGVRSWWTYSSLTRLELESAQSAAHYSGFLSQ